MQIIERILQLAEKKGMTANKMAVECKLNNSAVTQWKKGKIPSLEALNKIADYFNVSLDYLVGRSASLQNEIHSGHSAILPELIKKLYTVPPRIQLLTWEYFCDLTDPHEQIKKPQKEIAHG